MSISLSGLKGAFFNVYSAYEEFIGLGSETMDDSQISERDTLARTSSIINRYVFFIFLLPVLPPLRLFPNAKVIDVEMSESTGSGDLTEEEINRERLNSKEAIENHLGKQKIPLLSDTKHQLENHNSLNKKNITTFRTLTVNSDFLGKIVDSIDIIRMRELSVGLILCAKTLNEKLDLKRDYAVGVAEGKSQNWVAGLALPFLERMPTGSIDIFSRSEAIKIKTNITQFVVFDDASYSGTQMRDTVIEIKKAAYERFGYNRCELYLVIPFVSSQAVDSLQESSSIYETPGNLGVTLIRTSRKIKAIKEIFSEKELEEYYNNGEQTQQDLAKALYKCKGTMTQTEWKMADSMSTPQFLSKQIYELFHEFKPPYIKYQVN